MKKYFLIPDITENGTCHLFEVPSDLFVHVKACIDGVAIVIGDKTTDALYGYVVPASKSDLPLIEHIVKRGDTAYAENKISGMLCTRIAIFLEDESKAVFDIREHIVGLCEEIGYILHKTKLPEISGEGARKANRSKRHKHVKK